MDVREDNTQYTVLVNIPGADAKSLSVDLDGQRLTVRGKQEYEKQDRDASGRIIFSERRSGRFQRSITLREPVEQRGMQTKIDNGVLTIRIPKMK
jgi:HSP20 family protein